MLESAPVGVQPGASVENEDPSLADAVLAPATILFATVEHADTTRQLLDGISPSRFEDALDEGKQIALARFGSAIGTNTTQAFEEWIRNTRIRLGQVRPVWDEADKLDRGAFVDGIKAAVASKEFALGVKIGSVFGPWGAGIGGMVGSFLAGDEVDDAAHEAMMRYCRAVDTWWEAMLEDYNTVVLTGFEKDEALQRARAKSQQVTKGRRMLAMAVVGVVLVGLGFGAWTMLKRGNQQPPTQAVLEER